MPGQSLIRKRIVCMEDVRDRTVTVSNGPLYFPWFAPTAVNVSGFDQIFVKAVETVAPVNRDRHGNYTSENYSTTTTYSVQAICRSGPVELLNVGPDYDTAAEIEEHIEQFLGIEDREVRGEA